jgi:hypothetical protein
VQRVCVDGVNLGKGCTKTTEETDCPDSTCGFVAPKRAARTGQLERYMQMVQAGPETLIGSQFFRGRLDAFRLQPPGKSNCKLTTCPGTGTRCCLPRKESARSAEDLRMSPVGLAVAPAPDGQVLYVAAGEDDRVRAYRLYDNGLFRTRAPFDQTSEQNGSFPNAVAIAVLTDPCR